MQPPGLEVLLHQLAMGDLVGGIGLGQLRPQPTGAQQVEVQPLHSLARGDGPLVVPLVGQQIPAEPGHDRSAGGGLAGRQCPSGRGLELLEIDPHVGGRPEGHGVAAEDYALPRPHRLAGERGRLMQVGTGRLGAEVRPQRVHDLLRAQPAVRRQGQELDELDGTLARPSRPVDGRAVDRHDEAPEDTEFDLHAPKFRAPAQWSDAAGEPQLRVGPFDWRVSKGRSLGKGASSGPMQDRILSRPEPSQTREEAPHAVRPNTSGRLGRRGSV